MQTVRKLARRAIDVTTGLAAGVILAVQPEIAPVACWKASEATSMTPFCC